MSEPSRFVFTAMGSECILDLYSEGTLAAEMAEEEVYRIERRLSRYRDDSILSEIKRIASDGGTVELDDEMASLLDYAFACHRKSDGLFDITTGILRRAWNFSLSRTPSQTDIEALLPFVGLDKVIWERPKLSFPVSGVELDFGGIGKEYAADRAASVCAESGVVHGLVNLGGDIRIIGPKQDGSPWSVSIRDPKIPGQGLAAVDLFAGGLTTSGDYERGVTIDGVRYGHILNPNTGWPTRGLAAVSVIANTCLLAGSVSTIGMLKGEDGARWLAGLGIPCLWVDTEGHAASSAWPISTSCSQTDSTMSRCLPAI